MKKIFLLISSFISISAISQNPLLIKTVNGSTTEPGTNIINKQKTPWKGKIFYESKTGGHLVVTDGTNAGTQVVKTFESGYIPEAIYPAKDFVYVAVMKTDAVFVPPTSFIITYYRQLWKSDGTEAGTILLNAFEPTQSAANTGVFTSNSQLNANYSIDSNTIYFNGYDAINGNELWVSNGTPTGTRMVKNIRPGAASSNVRAFCKVGSTVCFSANDGTDIELWKTDGTEAGTTILKNINPSSGGFYGGECGIYKGKMYFWGNDGTNGVELWTTDGTENGTVMVKDITAGSGSSSGATSTRIDIMFLKDTSYLYFVLNNNGPVWRTDGTDSGTIQLHPDAAGGSTAGGAFANGNSMYWMVGTTTLYKTNGTVASTVKVRSDLSNGVGMIVYKNAAWFNARQGITDVEPWRSDGLMANRALNIAASTNSSDPFGYFELNNFLYFFAKPGGSTVNLYRYEGDMTFNGSQPGGRWRDSLNWNSMMPPGVTDSVFINAISPSLESGNAYAGTLIMQPGSSVNIVAPTDSLNINNSLQGTSFTGNGVLVLRNLNAGSVKISGPFVSNNLTTVGGVYVNSNITVTNTLKILPN